MDIVAFRDYCPALPGTTEDFPFDEQYSSITPGFHMNRKHWNTVAVDGSVPETLLYTLIKNSYALVVGGLTKKQRAELK